MKRQISILLVLSLMFSLSGCRKSKKKDPTLTDPAGTVQTPTTAPTTPTTPTVSTPEMMIAVSVGASTENTKANSGTIIFQHTTQKMRLVLHKPEIAEKIIIDFHSRVAGTDQEAAEIESAAKTAYNNSKNWIPYFYRLTYSPTRIDETVLSLVGDKITYSGAAHPERYCAAASYDLNTGDVLTLASIMTKEAKTDDFCKLVLEGLSSRSEGDYLYENYADVVKQRFTADATQDQNWYFSANGLCFYFVPYEIAPYASGVITVEIPYAKLQGLLYPDYFPAQRPTATGKVQISDFTLDSADKFTHTAELLMDTEGKMYLVHAEGIVQDIRITFTDATGTYTVFAANSLSAGEAVMIQANDDTAKNLELNYLSNGQTVKMSIK